MHCILSLHLQLMSAYAFASTHVHTYTAPLHRLKLPTLRKTYQKSLHLHRPQLMVSYHGDMPVAQAMITHWLAVVAWMDFYSSPPPPSPHARTAPPGANPTETQAQTPDTTGLPIQTPVPMPTALPTMRMGGMPGETPGMGGMPGAHMQQRTVMRPQWGLLGWPRPQGEGLTLKPEPSIREPHTTVSRGTTSDSG